MGAGGASGGAGMDCATAESRSYTPAPGALALTIAMASVAGSLSWSVDGQSVHTLSGVDVPDEQGRIVADVWAVESGSATSVLGSYVRGGATATFDSISYTAVSPVPEPAPMAMLFAGLGVLGWQQRRRGRTSA